MPIIDDIAAAHFLMVAHGDGNKQIWMTELGAPTGTAANAVTEKKGPSVIGKIVDFARQYSYIGPIYLYSLLDTGTDRADPGDNFGLLRRLHRQTGVGHLAAGSGGLGDLVEFAVALTDARAPNRRVSHWYAGPRTRPRPPRRTRRR